MYVYYDGTKWILSKNFTPLVLPSVYTTIGFINCNGDCDCPTGTWQQSSSIPNQDVYVTTEYKYTIEYFGNCTNGRCPAVKNKQKVIKPGYKTCACETWKYEEVSCKAAESLYKQVLQLRYGISNCCPEDDERYIVQKELIDLQCIIPPVEETPNCFFGLVLETIYLMEYSDIALLPLEWQNIGLGDPTSACGLGVGCHICNNALFELEADSVSLGESKMNNAGGNITTGSTTSYGTVICGDYDNTPAPLTGGSWAGNISSRYSKIVVDEDTAQALSDATSGGIITISAKCAKELYNCTLPDCSCALGFDGGCHTNVTFLRVTQGNILLYAGGIGGDIEVTIDPCSPIPIPPLPPLVINTIYTTFSALPPVPVPNVNTIYTTFSAFPPNVSYNCFLGVCADPGDGSGVYPTLLACDAACTFPPPNISYNCLNGNCTDPGDGSGVYATLIECENVCTDPPQVSYDCFLGICADPGDGSGVYPTLIACEQVCVPPPPPPPPVISYMCYNGSCILVSGPEGQYPTLAACEEECIPLPCASCTTAGRLPALGNSVTHNGVVISATGSGCVTTNPTSQVGIGSCPLPLPAWSSNSAWLGGLCGPASLSGFTYTLTFSVPVNDIALRLYTFGFRTIPYPNTSQGERFTFITNTGSGIPIISSCNYCCGIITNNTIIAADTSQNCFSHSPNYTTGNGIFRISNSVSFTTLTISGPGGENGSVVDICRDSLPVLPPVPCDDCVQQTLLPAIGNSITYSNGLTISATGTGSVILYTGPILDVCGFSTTPNSIRGGQPGAFTYTLNFSYPVNDFKIFLVAYDIGESFTLTTNTGGNTPNINLCSGCCVSISGNVITASNINSDCVLVNGGTGGSGLFNINNSLPFTSLTISGPGGFGGTLITFCDFLPFVTTYNCVNGDCVLVFGPSGQYPTLAACTNACTPPVTSYNCISGTCVLVSGSGGQFPTLLACQNNCGLANTIYTTFDIL